MSVDFLVLLFAQAVECRQCYTDCSSCVNSMVHSSTTLHSCCPPHTAAAHPAQLLPTPHSCCPPHTAAAHPTQLLPTPHSCCPSYTAAAHPTQLLPTPHSCCPPHTAAAHPTQLLPTPHSCCPPHTAAAHPTQLLPTPHSCCPPYTAAAGLCHTTQLLHICILYRRQQLCTIEWYGAAQRDASSSCLLHSMGRLLLKRLYCIQRTLRPPDYLM